MGDEQDSKATRGEPKRGPPERSRWVATTRFDPKRGPPKGQFLKALRQKDKLELRKRGQAGASQRAGGVVPGPGPPPAPPGPPGSVNWTPIGPSAIGFGPLLPDNRFAGRVRGIAAGPGSARVYAGAANGGVWLSENGGSTWKALDDYFVSPSTTSGREADALSVGALSVAFGASAATDVVYVGTGEPTTFAYFGVGIRRSTAGGAPGSWTLEGTNLAGESCYRIAIDPDDSSFALAATTAGLFRRPTSGSAATWPQVTGAPLPASGAATDVVVAGAGASKRFYAAFAGHGVYSSPDGSMWTALPGVTVPERAVLGVAPSDPSVVYALLDDNTVHRLAGAAFQPVSGAPPFPDSVAHWGAYALALSVHPTDPGTIYLAGYIAYRATVAPSGAAFAMTPTFLGNGIHADIHAVVHGRNAANTAFDPTNVWIGCDGGVWHSGASGAPLTFNPANDGLAVTELNYIAQRRDTDAVVYGGAQDNGTLRFFGEPGWYWAAGGDGGGVAVDQNDPNRVMRQYFRTALNATVDAAGGTWPWLHFPPTADPSQQNAADNEANAANFYSPIAVTPAGVVPTLAAVGTIRPWVTEDWGATWVTVPTGTNPYTPGGVDVAQDVLDGAAVETVVFASGTRLYAATQHQVWRFDRSGATWTSTAITTAGLPAGRYITDIAIHDAAAGSFYVSLGRGGVDHCWFFDGSAWHSAGLTAAVLDAPAHAITVDPSHPEVVYLGTDVGCFRGRKTGTSAWLWDPFSEGLPESAVVDLVVHDAARLLRAATYGRGAWERQLDAVSAPETELYLRVDQADTGRIVGGARQPFVEGAEDPTRRGAHVYHWMSPDIKVRRPSLAGSALPSPPDFLDFAFFVGDYVDSTDIETADATGTNHVFVQVHNRGTSSVPGSQVRVLLLVTDATTTLPALPADLAAQIFAGNATPGWLAGSGWRFADVVTPYRSPPGVVDARNPGVVDFPIDFSGLSLPTGHDHVCAAAFVTTTTTADQFTSTITSMDALTMADRHAAHRNLHLVTAGAMPVPPGGAAPGDQSPQPRVALLDFNNPFDEERELEVVVARGEVEGVLALIPPRGWPRTTWEELPPEKLEGAAGEYLRCWIEEARRALEGGASDQASPCLEPAADASTRERILSRLASLDLERALIVPKRRGSIADVRLAPGERVTAALVIPAVGGGGGPRPLRRFDVMVREGKKVLGGSSYFVAVGG